VLFEETAAHGLESVRCHFAKVSARVFLCIILNGEPTFENFFSRGCGARVGKCAVLFRKRQR